MASQLLKIARPKHHHKSPLLPYSTTTLTTANKPSHHKQHASTQDYLQPNPIIGSWDTPKNPKEANAKLALLRRDYAKQVKELRKQYIYEMEFQRQEQLRKDEAKKVEILRAREERNKSKAAVARARALERKQFEHEFKQTLMKEREDKLNYWRTREKAIEDKKQSAKEHIRRQSSLWVDENELEAKVFRTLIDTSRL